jgi:hypothetical protein
MRETFCSPGFSVGVGVGVGVGVVRFLTTTPLFQISFFPNFTQVNFLPSAISMIPAFAHGSPGLTAATAVSGVAIKIIAKKAISSRFTPSS